MQPGETITPGAAQPPAPEPEKQDQPATPVERAPQPTEVASVAPASTPPSEPVTPWQFADDGAQSSEPDAPQPTQTVQPVTWSASEYIAHNKGPSWFVFLGICLFIFIAGVYAVTRDIFASVMVGVAGTTFGVFAARPPRVLEYAVDSRGINIGQKFYAYGDFKSFAIVEDGPLPAVMLLPLKRFLPPITVFYEPKQEDTILNVIADYLPHEEKQPDVVDKLMSRIRF